MGVGGNRGRPRKPTHLHLVDGTARASRMNPKEPNPESGIPAPPTWMSKKGKTLYSRLGILFDKSGVAKVTDADALAMLADAMDLYQIVRDYLAKNGTTYETMTDNGPMRRPHPEFAQAKELRTFIYAALGTFGATPSSRSRVVSEVTQEEDPMESFLRG